MVRKYLYQTKMITTLRSGIATFLIPLDKIFIINILVKKFSMLYI